MNKTTIRIIIAVVLLILILLFFFGCQNNSQAKLEAENIEIVKKYLDGWNQRDSDLLLELFDSNYTFYAPVNTSEPSTREETVKAIEEMWGVIPDITITIDKIFGSGDMVTSLISVKGTHTNNAFGIPTTNIEFVSSGLNVIRIENGNIIKEWESADWLGLLTQLGMELKPKE